MQNIQKIFYDFGNSYLSNYGRPNYLQLKVFNNIISCKTKNMGVNIYKCPNCNHKVFIYNSCKDRHCPSCMEYKRELWINNHKKDILNVDYLHVVFTIPRELHKIFYHNQLACYNILLKVSSKTILDITKGKGYTPGILSILHTWTQLGNYHPHIHMILTNGGLKKYKWIDNIDINLDKLENKFKNNLINELKKSNLTFYNDIDYLNDKLNYYEYLDKLKDIRFICYYKEPFNSVDSVYEYLSKYVYKVCMSNDRIIKINKTTVRFKYKDTSDRNIEKYMSIKGEEYIRRFLLHVLPKGFMKIRYYGIYQNKNKLKRLIFLKILTNTKLFKLRRLNKTKVLYKINQKDVTRCNHCQHKLYLYKEIKKKKPPGNILMKEIMLNA